MRRRGRRPGTPRGGEPPLQPLCVLLLPTRLEDFALRERAKDLLGAPGTIAVEPAPLGYRRLGRAPELVRDGVAAAQARRMALPGEPRAIVLFDLHQYPLARALLALHPGTELWYGLEPRVEPPERLRDLHEAALARAALTFAAAAAPGEPPRALNRPLWERMEALGVESGRLGSERLGP